MAHRTHHPTPSMPISAVLALLLCCAALLATPAAAAADAPPAGETDTLRTWWHDNADPAPDGTVGDGDVRRSPFYSTSVATVSAPDTRLGAFTYLSIPRGGAPKIGYDAEDGADFAADAGLSMSWSSFEYAEDVDVDVSLDTGQRIASADQVTVRPLREGLAVTLVDDHTVRIRIPYRDGGYRISVEFEPQVFTAYNDLSAGSGRLTEAGGGEVSREPRNAMLVFAQPKADGPSDTIPDPQGPGVQQVTPGSIRDLEPAASTHTLYFGPGTYWMGEDHHMVLPDRVTWVYLAPGAYVKGAFRFLSTQAHLKVTGTGVLSGEQYVYEADTENGYRHRDESKDNCHGSCVKMLQFESTGEPQQVDLQGVTVANPPYHSFVMYGQEDGPFAVHARNYQQVGAWYWQTDGLELYRGSTLRDSFLHANDDAVKLYHSDVTVTDTVVWKGENGPVFQWGWSPRTVHNVLVERTDVIHNRMYWNDRKSNTCVLNAAPSWQDPSATDTADRSHEIRDLTIRDTNVEGMVNCAIRIAALQDMHGVLVDGLHIGAWNGVGIDAQQSLFSAYTDKAGDRVEIGTGADGLLLRDYTVGGEPVLKAADNWAYDETGRLDFDRDLDGNWDAVADGLPAGTPPTLQVSGLADGETVADRDVTLTGTTDAATVRVTVNGDTVAETPVEGGAFSIAVHLPALSNRVRVTAVSADGGIASERYVVTALGRLVGAIEDAQGDDYGPGTYRYPTDGAFSPGSFDLRALRVYEDGDTVRFVTAVEGTITNPWGGHGMSTQRVNVYVRDAADASGGVTPMLPGTNTFADWPWNKVVVADGRNDGARFASGVYSRTGNGVTRDAGGEVDVLDGRTIIASVPADAFDGIDLARAGYQVLMLSSAEDGEGIGNVRPVYGDACWNGDGCPSYVQQYRFGGGLGIVDDSPAKDSVTTDSNAIDILDDGSQAQLLALDREQAVLPFVTFARQDGGRPDGGHDGDADGDRGGHGDGGDHADHAASPTPTDGAPTAPDGTGHAPLARSGTAVLAAVAAAAGCLAVAAALLARRRRHS